MKIDNKVLKKLYKIYLEGKSPPSRLNCPDPDNLIESLRTNLSRKKREELIEHLSSCIHCSREFEFLLGTVRIENEITEKAKNIFSKRDETKKRRPRFTSRLLSRYAWRYLSASAMFILLIVITIFIFKIPQKIEFRRIRASPIRVIYPNEINLDISKLKFNWRTAPDADYYILEIFNDAMLSIWRSEKLSENHFQPLPSLLKKIEKGKTYFWMVTAYTEAGLKTESTLVDFYIKK